MNNNVCPQCNGSKDRRSKLCHPCYHKNRDKVNEGKRMCNKCKKLLDITNFRIRTRPNPKPRPTCKECESKWYKEHAKKIGKQEITRRKKEQYHKHPITVKKQMIRSFCYKMGLDKNEAIQISEEFFTKTNCDICKRHKDEIGTLCIDHCHKTNKIRGYLCNACNLSLGMLKDSISTLENAIKYLNQSES